MTTVTVNVPSAIAWVLLSLFMVDTSLRIVQLVLERRLRKAEKKGNRS